MARKINEKNKERKCLQKEIKGEEENHKYLEATRRNNERKQGKCEQKVEKGKKYIDGWGKIKYGEKEETDEQKEKERKEERKINIYR